MKNHQFRWKNLVICRNPLCTQASEIMKFAEKHHSELAGTAKTMIREHRIFLGLWLLVEETCPKVYKNDRDWSSCAWFCAQPLNPMSPISVSASLFWRSRSCRVACVEKFLARPPLPRLPGTQSASGRQARHSWPREANSWVTNLKFSMHYRLSNVPYVSER